MKMAKQQQQKKYPMRHDSVDKCIYPMSDRMLGPYFSVMLTRNGTCFQKSFFESRLGGTEYARKLATAWRDKIIAENPPTKLADFCAILRSVNKTGIAGVSRRSREYLRADGQVAKHDSWKAILPTGMDASLQAAINWRDQTYLLYKQNGDSTAVIQHRSAQNTSGATGVFFDGMNDERTRGYCVARSPKQKGKPTRSRRFSIAKYGFKDAFERAVCARAELVAAIVEQPAPTHLVARKLHRHLRQQASE